METKTPAGHAESSATDLARLRAELQGTHRRIDDLTDRTERGFAAVHQHLEDIPSPWAQRIDAGDALLAQRIDDATAALTQRMEDHIHHTDRSFDGVNERFDVLTRRMETGFGQIRSFQWGLLTGIALLLLRTFVKL